MVDRGVEVENGSESSIENVPNLLILGCWLDGIGVMQRGWKVSSLSCSVCSGVQLPTTSMQKFEMSRLMSGYGGSFGLTRRARVAC